RRAERAVPAALLRGGVVLQDEMKALLTPAGPSAPGQPPGRRSGNLRRSIQVGRVENGRVRVGTSLLLGRWLERGVFVKPKRGKFLAIPLNQRAQRMYARLGGSDGVRASLRTLNLKLIKM